MLNISELDDFELLVRTHRARLLRLVAFSTGDQDLAETVVQDALLKASNARDNFRGESSVGTWLRAIALNVMRDYQRRQKFQFWKKAGLTGLSVSDAAISLASGDPSPEARMLAREQVQRVQLALKFLPETYSTAWSDCRCKIQGRGCKADANYRMEEGSAEQGRRQ
jgi:RNA polymerase sigma-70 factor, ECF subfamily